MSADTTAADGLDGRVSTAAAFPRHEQTFPTLTSQEIARMRRFGDIRNYRDGERLFETGRPAPACSWCWPAMSRSPSATASAM